MHAHICPMDTLSRKTAGRTAGSASLARSIAEWLREWLNRSGERPGRNETDRPGTVAAAWSETLPMARSDSGRADHAGRGATADSTPARPLSSVLP